MEGRVLRHRVGIYVLINAGVFLAALFGSLAGNASAGTAIYAWVLLVLCSAPFLWMQRFNDRYALLMLFMGSYFLFFGALSLRNVLLGSDLAPLSEGDFMTSAQFAVLLGAVLVLGGYRFGSSLVRPIAQGENGTDFPNGIVLVLGLVCWTLGSAALAYYAIIVTPENSFQATARGLASMGPLLTFVVMLGYLVQPLGVVILSYGYAKNRTGFWLILVLTMICLQLFLGFITDTKGTALFGILLVAITQALWDNKVPKSWVAGILVFAILVFPVLQASRVVRGEYGLNRAQAFEHFSEMVARAWESREKVNEGRPQQRAQTFLERSSGEATLEPVFEHAGIDTPFLYGRTLAGLQYAFIPRLLLPDKEAVSAGQLYNHVFLHAASDDFTYISFSVLGEFYWNFGWPGVVGGMLLTGFVLGVTGAKSSLAEKRSLSRLLILLVSIMQLCFGFGGTIAVASVVWMRAMAAIGLMHALFARPTAPAAKTRQLPAKLEHGVSIPASTLPAFPNMMR